MKMERFETTENTVIQLAMMVMTVKRVVSMLLDQWIVYSRFREQVYIILRDDTPRVDCGMCLENVTDQHVDFACVNPRILIGHLHVDVVNNHLIWKTPMIRHLRTVRIASLS